MSDSDTLPGGCIVAIAAAVVALIVGVTMVHLTTYEGVPPDKIGLHYSGGQFDGTHFVEILDPGHAKKMLGLSEHLYLLPATQRNYIVSKTVGQGDEAAADSISAPSKDRVAFTFEAAVYFKLNQDRRVIRQFFEQICLHDHCYKDSGWDDMLRQFFRKPLEQAIAQEAKKYGHDDLYSDAATLDAMNREISQGLADDINSAIGGNYFCGPDSHFAVVKGKRAYSCGDFRVIIKNPTPPSSVTDAYDAQAAAQQKVAVAKREAEAAVQASIGKAQAAREAAQGDRDAQDIRASAKTLTQAQLDYVRAQALLACANNTNCTLVVTPSGTNVQVNAGP